LLSDLEFAPMADRYGRQKRWSVRQQPKAIGSSFLQEGHRHPRDGVAAQWKKCATILNAPPSLIGHEMATGTRGLPDDLPRHVGAPVVRHDGQLSPVRRLAVPEGQPDAGTSLRHQADHQGRVTATDLHRTAPRNASWYMTGKHWKDALPLSLGPAEALGGLSPLPMKGESLSHPEPCPP
jgi:hypothetical protein